ncbi:MULTISPECIES: lytic transglycosylase domain-containing protein [unclassified Lentilitoribacter]|jgi:soluble lytic murein transglycosylase-like protein|uniref:lytic transglycosylase domain-containing protein n=1 Tax=unclassified Lentilitoribacter TaxID=2647570 RepID=UPI0013A69385|nr:transglycosylase SLT domain-containing protein [Lentilitoribacter sp. Alg239-R112]
MKLNIAAGLTVSLLSLSACQTANSVDKSTKTSSVSKSTKNSAPYNKLISKHAKKNGVPVKLAHAIVKIESNYKASARGRAGEVGLMQIKPATARGMGYTGSTKALYNPENNIAYGMKYLGEAYKRGGGTTCGAILKYNAGHYAKRMNPVSAKYCQKVKAILR